MTKGTSLKLGCSIAAISAAVITASIVSTSAMPNPSTVMAAGHARSEEMPDDSHVKTFHAASFPFTGLTDAERTGRLRPVMVMVENSAAARPQSGLDQADIIYEILAESNITRFVAVYHSHSPKTVGPVRSIRPYYVEIGDGLDAIIVHAGWSQQAMNIIADRQLNHFDQVYGDSAYYWRSVERKAPHNLYTSIGRIRQGADERHFRSEWKEVSLPFQLIVNREESSQPVQSMASGIAATSVLIPYTGGYAVGYRYDSESKQYKREMNGAFHMDKETGNALTATNILICKARHWVIDSDGRREVDVFGPGTGYLVQQGQAREVIWKRDNGMIRAYADGRELMLNPGQTWVQVVPETSTVTFSAY